MTRAPGIRATASAAPLALSTVVLAATPASRPKFSTFERASFMLELNLAACSSNQRPMLPKKPGDSAAAGGLLLAAFLAASCAKAIAPVSRIAPAQTHARRREAAARPER